MAERLYIPDKGWWDDVAELDRTLFDRGAPSRVGLAGRFGQRRILNWRADEKDIHYASERLTLMDAKRHVGVDLFEVEELPVGGLRSLNLGEVGLVRRVRFVPTGINVSGDYGVTDRVHTIGNLGEMKKNITEEDQQALKDALAKAREEQDTAGFSNPTEETYIFIYDKLVQGEESTRYLA